MDTPRSHIAEIKNSPPADFEYFEIEIRRLERQTADAVSAAQISVRNISGVIQNQQSLSDKLYQDAIEANFSHEQMNPLNSILVNSGLVYTRFARMIRQLGNEN